MKKLTVLLSITFLLTLNPIIHAETINETDSDVCSAFKFALIQSLRDSVNSAIQEIYMEDENAPDYLQWDAFDTKILKIKQLYGIGGAYEITLEVHPYYRAHISYGVDQIVLRENGKIVDYKHIKTYPLEDFS